MINLNILDSPMGTGKTTAIIKYMNLNPNRKYIFISPFLSEGERIIDNCPNLNFVTPKDLFSKSADLKNLISEGKNIVSTHALFKIIDDKTIELLKLKDYVLIMDEIIDIIDKVNISEKDKQILFDTETININEENKIQWLDSSYKGKFSKIKQMAENNRLCYMDNKFIIWTFPVEAFKGFKDVYVLTYLFKGSKLKAYFDSFNVEYRYWHIENDYDIKEGFYNDKEFKDNVSNLINIYEGKLNNIGLEKNALSVTWFRSRKNKDKQKQLKNNTYNYFRHVISSPSDKNMWSVFSNEEKKFKGNGYANGFVPCNCRATNDYRDKETLAYLVNIYENPLLKRWFEQNKSTLSEDDFALSQLLQWVWRSQVRDGKKINLYLPSSRMRDIYNNWLNN